MLRAIDIFASYGPVPVLTGVHLEVSPREVLALLGRNGVGKSTLMRTLVGLIRPSAGRIEFNASEITGEPPHRIAQLGLAYVPQGHRIFPKLTVWENLLVGTRARADGRQDVPEEVFVYFPVLKEQRRIAGTLSGGQQQMLAIARALCGNPRLLLLDEPSEGIQPSIVYAIGEFLKTVVRTKGLSVLLVEQNLDLALGVASRCAVMEKGRIARQGTPQEFQDEALLRRYLAI